MSLDATLSHLNDTLKQVASLLEAVEVAVFILAISIGIALIGCTAAFFFGKYNQRGRYNRLNTANASLELNFKPSRHVANV